MERILNTDLVVAHVGRWHAGDLAFIESLDFMSNSSQGPSKLSIVALFQRRDRSLNGWPSPDVPFVRVWMEFESVSEFEIKSFGPGHKQIMGFDIKDFSDRQLEGIVFSIGDYENGDISFYCRQIRIVQAEPAT